MDKSIEQTLFLIKPDGIEKDLENVIFDIIKKNNLKVVRYKIVQPEESIKYLKKHYQNIENKPFFNDVIAYMTRGPISVGIIEGTDAIKKWRSVMGATNPKDALEGTIRALYGDSKTFENVVHGSDSLESAKKEISIWFPEDLNSQTQVEVIAHKDAA